MKLLAKAMTLLSPSCKEASRLQSRALDQKLPALERLGLRIHLTLCKWCRRYGKQIRFLRDAAHHHLADNTSQKLSQSARDRIKQRLQDEEV